MESVKKLIKVIKDFPKPGINFLDISRVTTDREEYKHIIDFFTIEAVASKAQAIIAPESRGFLFACPAAVKSQMPFLMIRKEGKLPNDGTQVSFSADKEYGRSSFVVNKSDLDLLKSKGIINICLIDDVLATGNTALGIAEFFKEQGFNVVSQLNFIEIEDLDGSKLLQDNGISSKSYIKF